MADHDYSSLYSKIDDDKLLKVKDVALILELSPQTIRKWIGDGRISVKRLGSRTVRLRWGDVKNWIENQ